MGGKRSNGEGTIYRRKDGRFLGQVYVLAVGGKRKRISAYGKTSQEVQEKLNVAKMQTQQGVPVPDHNWKLGEYLDYWLEYAVRIKRRPLTYRRSEAIVRLYLKPSLGRSVLHGLSVQKVQDFVDQLYREEYSAASIYQIRKVLSAALTYAMRQELVVRNVARLVELPTYRPHEAPHWTADEATQFLQAARPDPLYPAFVILVLYGLRRGEVLGLRWCDVDFELGVLHVRQQIQRIEGKLRQVPLKTQTSERDEPLLATAREVLRAQQANQAAVRMAVGDRWQGGGTDEELVFTTRTGLPVESHNLARSFLRICETHGLRRITIHGLRHTNATAQKNLHVHARDIQAILGHGDVRTTGIYEHVELDSKRGALEKVEQQFFKPAAVIVDRGRSSNPSQSRLQNIAQVTSFNFGGASQTRTGDTRLFRSRNRQVWGGKSTVQHRLQSVVAVMEVQTRTWLVGCIAVTVAVKTEQFMSGEIATGSMFGPDILA